jgi:hypothetical protein
MRGEENTQFNLILSKRRTFRVLFLALWASSILLLLVLGITHNIPVTSTINSKGKLLDLNVPKNQIGGFAYIRRDPNEDGRVIQAVSFRELCVSNDKLGIFKTGLFKTVGIDDFKTEFYRDTCLGTAPNTQHTNYTQPKDLLSNITSVAEVMGIDTGQLAVFLDELTEPRNGWHLDMDFSNLSQICINGFDLRVNFKDGTLFGICCKKVAISPAEPILVFRGHVTIVTADCGKLESNRVEWDTANRCFNVRGGYVLSRNGVKTIGKDIYLDCQLNEVRPQQAKTEGNRRKACFARVLY